jgi:hypothetical protein
MFPQVVGRFHFLVAECTAALFSKFFRRVESKPAQSLLYKSYINHRRNIPSSLSY